MNTIRKDGAAILHPYNESVEEAAERIALDRYSQENNPSMEPNKRLHQRLGFYNGFLACIEWQKNQKK